MDTEQTALACECASKQRAWRVDSGAGQRHFYLQAFCDGEPLSVGAVGAAGLLRPLFSKDSNGLPWLQSRYARARTHMHLSISSGSHGPVCRMHTCGLALAAASASAFVSVCAHVACVQASNLSNAHIALVAFSPLLLSFFVSDSVSGAILPDAHGNGHLDQLYPPLLRGTAHAF